ncbi:MAG: Dyp-type peroxidase [Gammaproteobacteria bacterium]
METDYRTTQLEGVTDLTVVARLKPGAVPGAFNTVPYAERLKRVLTTLNALRQAARESSLVKNPFPDAVARFRTVHFFRFGVLPAEGAQDRPRLFLNVTVDSGWEPYMRFIWKPIGSMLDILFCHCEDYPLARVASYQEYIAWVRNHEVMGRFFFTDSTATVTDGHYLRSLGDLVHERGHHEDFDLLAARLHEPTREADPKARLAAAVTALRALRAVHGLRELFPEADDRTSEKGVAFRASDVLLRFAQDLFAKLHHWACKPPARLRRNPAWQALTTAFAAELAWLGPLPNKPRPSQPGTPRAELYGGVQAGIACPYPAGLTHGVVALLRVTDAVKARAWLTRYPVSSAACERPRDGVFHNLALTFVGLKRLGAPPDFLARLPREFIDGMAARAGVLGDLHHNHPDHWRLPARNWPPELATRALPPVQPSSVDVVLQMRVALPGAIEAYDDTRPVAPLAAALAALDVQDNGIEILHVQPMHHLQPRAADALSREHFGFLDGVSQPSLEAPATPRKYWQDQVLPGEFFLGRENIRGDRDGGVDELLDLGSFLVVRKLRQHTARYRDMVSEAARALHEDLGVGVGAARELIGAKLMGRHADGRVDTPHGPVHGNDFNFADDPDGRHCPLRSHIRRTNPREDVPPLLAPPPRIARRGMTYGPTGGGPDGSAEHGLMFLCYNASIAEQFEVIQNWVAGGGSTGLPSEQDDPLLGVVEPGRPRSFRFEHGKQVHRFELGHAPLVELEWGLYAFAPSLAALSRLETAWSSSEGAKVSPPPPPLAPDLDSARLLFEEDNARGPSWAAVRAQPHGRCPVGPYGLLVADHDEVLRILKEAGEQYSVAGMLPRMEETVGPFFLGMDANVPGADHQLYGRAVNAVIEAHFADERLAYDAALRLAARYLDDARLRARALRAALGRKGALIDAATIDLVDLVRDVVGRLCGEWFGVLEGGRMQLGSRADDLRPLGAAGDVPRCPGDLLAISRYVFSPHPPEDPVALRARALGVLVKAAFRDLVANGPHTPLVAKIVAAVPGSLDLKAAMVGGSMLGFPAPVVGSLVTVLVLWVRGRQLWDLQQNLASVPASLPYAEIDTRLRGDLLRTMAMAPTPYAVWRRATPAADLAAAVAPGCPVVLGLGAAMQDPRLRNQPDAHLLMFGGTHQEGHDYYAPHACPGYALSMGVMLAVAASVLRAGDLRPTPDARVLKLMLPPD